MYISIMEKHYFHFKNQGPDSQDQNKRSSFNKGMTKLVFVSSFSVFIGFLSLKVSKYFTAYNKSSPLLSTEFSQKNAVQEVTHFVPLFVNLKGEQGPQLVRLQVSLSVEETSKQELLSQEGKLEKHILFLLSGQSAEALFSRKDHFEQQIRFHLNAFLSKQIIHGVQIQTQTFN